VWDALVVGGTAAGGVKALAAAGFGLAAMLGELACLAVALFLAPALLWAMAPASARGCPDALS
jgi:hypothetical protein